MKRSPVGTFIVGIVAGMLCVLGLGMLPTFSSLRAQTPPPEMAEIRGVWLTNIDSEVLFSRDNLEEGLARLARLNFNTIYPTVWQGGYTLYPSEVVRRATGRSQFPEPGLAGRDALAEVVEEGRERGLRVIPWFEFGFMAPADSELVRRHGHWLAQRADGTVVWHEGVLPRVWLNPLHPEVQDFILELIAEIVANYEVDGIQFDDHMAMPSEFGYDLYTVYLYQQEHDGRLPPLDTDDPEWLRWRADKITEFMARAFATVKTHCPDCTVSVSPNPQHWAYPVYLQDWETWERRGLVEELVLQVYRNDLERFETELAYPEVQAARRHIPVAIGILSGLRNRPTDIQQLRSQVEAARDGGFAGVSFFFYESLWWGDESPTAREAILQDLFATPAEPARVGEGEFAR